MQQIYSHLLTLTFHHKYFKDNLFGNINFSFSEGISKLIYDFGIVIKIFPGGLIVLAADPDLLEYDLNPIRIYLHCNDPLYINYTLLPRYKLADQLLYINNLSVVPDQENEGFRLHSDGFVGQNEVVQLTHGKVNISTFDPNKQNLFTDATGNEIPAQHLKLSANNTTELMISGLPEGLVYFQSDNMEERKFYYQPKAIWKNPMGVVEIYPGKLFSQFKENGKIEYAVNFDNRQTIWKYFFVSPIYQKFNNLSIINKGKEQIFSAPRKMPVHKNPEALVFESKSKIPLAELSDETYQLVDNYDPELRTGKVIHKNLAKASPEQLYFDTAKSDESVYSHIYI